MQAVIYDIGYGHGTAWGYGDQYHRAQGRGDHEDGNSGGPGYGDDAADADGDGSGCGYLRCARWPEGWGDGSGWTDGYGGCQSL